MVTLRHFEREDAPALRESRYPDMAAEEVRDMIDNWNKGKFQGRYFEMFAVMSDGGLAGTVSLYHRSKSAVSIGPEVFPPFRGGGIGRAAMLSAMKRAKDRGYKIAMQQVRSANAASIALHKSLGFETDGYGYVNKKGDEVFILLKLLD